MTIVGRRKPSNGARSPARMQRPRGRSMGQDVRRTNLMTMAGLLFGSTALAASAVDAEVQPLERIDVTPGEAHLVERALAEAHRLIRGVRPVALVRDAARAIERELRRERRPRGLRPVLVVGDRIGHVPIGLAGPRLHARAEAVLMGGDGHELRACGACQWPSSSMFWPAGMSMPTPAGNDQRTARLLANAIGMSVPSARPVKGEQFTGSDCAGWVVR